MNVDSLTKILKMTSPNDTLKIRHQVDSDAACPTSNLYLEEITSPKPTSKSIQAPLRRDSSLCRAPWGFVAIPGARGPAVYQIL